MKQHRVLGTQGNYYYDMDTNYLNALTDFSGKDIQVKLDNGLTYALPTTHWLLKREISQMFGLMESSHLTQELSIQPTHHMLLLLSNIVMELLPSLHQLLLLL